MKLRFSPCRSLCLGVLGILFLFNHSAFAQCNGDFSFQSVSSSTGSSAGTIEVSLNNTDPGLYTFKVYAMGGALSLIQTKQVSNPDKIIFDKLKPANYFIKIEWGESCSKVLGGLDGIIITGKDQER